MGQKLPLSWISIAATTPRYTPATTIANSIPIANQFWCGGSRGNVLRSLVHTFPALLITRRAKLERLSRFST